MKTSTEIRSVFLEGDIEAGINAIRDLAEGMTAAFDSTLHGVITDNPEHDIYINAYNWLVNNYQACAGAFRSIFFMADAISTPFVNADAEIVPRKHNFDAEQQTA